MKTPDRSNGYEAVAKEFIAGRGTSGRIGVNTVQQWADTLPRGADVLDLGCGNGIPISQTLMGRGLTVHGVDASPSMIASFRARFPDASAECNSVEESNFFNRTFDGVIAWGLIFLLAPPGQSALIGKVAKVLKPQGQFLFTSPRRPLAWDDAMTGQGSVSLGAAEYARLLAAEGLVLVDDHRDEGDNDYYLARKGRC